MENGWPTFNQLVAGSNPARPTIHNASGASRHYRSLAAGQAAAVYTGIDAFRGSGRRLVPRGSSTGAAQYQQAFSAPIGEVRDHHAGPRPGFAAGLTTTGMGAVSVGFSAQ
ncbi:MAG: hypothetical protein AB8B57_03085 [Congregibacter sp.]